MYLGKDEIKRAFTDEAAARAPRAARDVWSALAEGWNERNAPPPDERIPIVSRHERAALPYPGFVTALVITDDHREKAFLAGVMAEGNAAQSRNRAAIEFLGNFHA